MRAIIYGRPGCTYCNQAKDLCETYGMNYDYQTVGVDISKEELGERVGHQVKTVPQIFLQESAGFWEYIGGYEEFRGRLKLKLM